MTETSTGCPIQVVLAGEPEDCTFTRGHELPHSWAVPTAELVTAPQRAAEAGLVVVDPADLRAALTAKGTVDDGVYDRLWAALEVKP